MIRNLERTDTELIQFIKDRLVPWWQTSVEEIENEYILTSFGDGFPYIFIACTEGGEFAGKIILSIEKNWFLGIDNQPWISGLFVPEKFRGHSIGQKLIAKAEETVKAKGCETLYLDTSLATGYYDKIGGWQKLGEDVYKGDVVTIMSKSL